MAEPGHDGSDASNGGQPGLIAGVPMPMGGMGPMGGGSASRGGGAPASSGGTRIRTTTPTSGSGRSETTTRSPNESGRRVPKPSTPGDGESSPNGATPSDAAAPRGNAENGPPPAQETPAPTENAQPPHETPGDEAGRPAPARPLTDGDSPTDPAHRPIEDVDGQGVVRSETPPAEPGQPEQTPSGDENAPPERPLTDDNGTADPSERPIEDVDDQGVVHGGTEPEQQNREAAPQDGEPDQHKKEGDAGEPGDHDGTSGHDQAPGDDGSGEHDGDHDGGTDDASGGNDEPQSLSDAEQEAREILAQFGDDAPTVDFTSHPIDPAAAHEINRAIRQLAADYPDTMRQLNRIDSVDVGHELGPGEEDTLAYARLHGDSQGIYVNNEAFGDNASLGEDGAAEEADGFTVPGGGSAEGIFTHEFGHQLGQRLIEDPVMRAELNKAISDALGVPYDVTQPHDPAMRARIENALSQYGATTPHEALAEAFTEHRLAENPRDLARAIGGVMDRHLRAQTPEPGPSTGDGTPTSHNRTAPETTPGGSGTPHDGTLPRQPHDGSPGTPHDNAAPAPSEPHEGRPGGTPHDRGTPEGAPRTGDGTTEPARTPEQRPAEGAPRHSDGQMRPDDGRPRAGEPGHDRSEEPPRHDAGELPLDERRPPGETEPRPDDGRPRSGEPEPRPDDGRPRSNETEPRPGERAPGEEHTRPGEEHTRPGEGHTRPGEGEEPLYRRSRPAGEEPDPVGGDDSGPPADPPAGTPAEEPGGRRPPHQQAEWNPPRHTREGELELAPGQRVAASEGLAANTRYTVYQSHPDGRIPRSVVHTDGEGRVTHVTNYTSEEPGARVVPPSENVDVTRPEPGVTHRIELGYDNPHIFAGEEHPSGQGAAPSAARFDPPADATPHKWSEPYNPKEDGPFADKQPNLPKNARIEVTGPDNKLHGVFWTDGDGNITHVRTWYGDKEHGFNPELGDRPADRETTAEDGAPKPNTHYLVEPHDRFQVENPTRLDPPDAVRRGDFGDGVDPGTFLYHTDERGQAQTASGRPEYNTGRQQRLGPVQTDVGRTGGGYHRSGNTPDIVGEYDGGRFDGGHIFPHEARGPGERINYFPQESRTNRGNRGMDFEPKESWRHSFEAHLHAQDGANHKIERIDFFPEPNDPRMTPEVVHVRWTETVPSSDPNVPDTVQTHYRTFHNVEPSLRGSDPPDGSVRPTRGGESAESAPPPPDEPQRRTRGPRPEPGDERVAPLASTGEPAPPAETAASPEPAPSAEPAESPGAPGERPAADAGQPVPETAPESAPSPGGEAGASEGARPDAHTHYGWYESEGPGTAPRTEGAAGPPVSHTAGTPGPLGERSAAGSEPRPDTTPGSADRPAETARPGEDTSSRSEHTAAPAEGGQPRPETSPRDAEGPGPRTEPSDAEAPRTETPRPETARPETPRAETPRAETPRAETPRPESPRPESPAMPGETAPRAESDSHAEDASTTGPRPAERAGHDEAAAQLEDATPRADAAPQPEARPDAQPRSRAAEPEGERPRTADPELMRRVHENEQIRQIVDQARDTVVNDRGDRLGDLLDEDLRTRLPNHPELARIIEGSGPPALTDAERAIHDSLLARPRTLHSLLTHPEAVHILEDSVREVNERGADAVLDEGPAAPAPTPLEDWQTRISDRMIEEIGTSKAPGQPGFDHEALAAAQERAGEDRPLPKDDPLVNDYLDRLYDAADEHKGTLHAVLRDLANEPEDAKMRPGRKDRVRALDKIINENDGDASTLNDLLGGKVQFDGVADLYRALDRVQDVTRRHGVEVVSIKDRLRSPQPSGYRDIRMTVRMPNGHIGELRLHLRSFDAVAEHEHSLYEVSRDLPNVAEEGAARGERGPGLTPEERAVREAINRRLNEQFKEALDQALPPELRSAHEEAPPESRRREAGPHTPSEGMERHETAPAHGIGHGTREPGAEGHGPAHEPVHEPVHEDGRTHDGEQAHEGEHEPVRPDGAEIPADLPPHLHEVFRGSDETPAGRSFHDPSDPAMRDLASRVPADPHRFVVDGHGDADGLRLGGGRRLGADDLADLIRNDPNWNGREVLLLSCHTADGEFAARLAERLGVPVVAPHGLAWSDGDGNVYASSGHPDADGQVRPGLPPDGSWTAHHPDGTAAPAGHDGYAPGHRGGDDGRPRGDAEARGLRDWFRRRRDPEPPAGNGWNGGPPHTGHTGHADPRRPAPGHNVPHSPASGHPAPHPAGTRPAPHHPGGHVPHTPGAHPGPHSPAPHNPGGHPAPHNPATPAAGTRPAPNYPAPHTPAPHNPGTHNPAPHTPAPHTPASHPATHNPAAHTPATHNPPPHTPAAHDPRTAPPAHPAGTHLAAHTPVAPGTSGVPHVPHHPGSHGTPHHPAGHPGMHDPGYGTPHHGEGRVDPDGVRRFNADDEGARYGENRLAHVFQQLPPHLQNAVRWYTWQSMPNGHLRPNGDVAGYLNHLHQEQYYVRTLTHLNGGAMPHSHQVRHMLTRPDLTPYQRQLVDYVTRQPNAQARLLQMWNNHLERERLRDYLGGEPNTDAFWRRIGELDQALNQPLPEAVQVLRGLHDVRFLTAADGAPLGDRHPSLLIGATQMEPAYMSTSLGVNTTQVDGKDFEIRVHMNVPRGAPGLWMGVRSMYPGQRELVLPRGVRYRVTSVVHTGMSEDGVPTFDVHADVIPPNVWP
ncbi:ADP-ribosyltransferase [Actinomadura napierensis]|uniref:ADP-ribosyltransferase n=1 Tax=Actinomadura napierensis TaxID=267854 RepID=UPI0031DD91C8